MPAEQLPGAGTVRSAGESGWRCLRGDWIIIFLAIVCSIIRLKYAYLRASTPFQLEYEEGNILNAGFRILHGATPYPSPGSFPYVMNPYGPVAYLIAAAAMKLLGVSLFGPRFFVLLAGVAVVFLIVLLARLQGSRIEIACLFGFFYFCSPVMWEWLALLRVDLWAVF